MKVENHFYGFYSEHKLIIMLIFISHLLCIGHCAKDFIYIILCISHSNPVNSGVPSLFIFSDEETNTGEETDFFSLLAYLVLLRVALSCFTDVLFLQI